MEKNKQEQWIDEVFDSWKGSQRAEPDDTLFESIEQELTPIISIRTLSFASAAAVALLILNAFIVQQYSGNHLVKGTEQAMHDSQNLISNYSIYE